MAYLNKVSRAGWILNTEFGNHGTIAQHGNFTQNWDSLNPGFLKSQTLKRGDEK